MVVRMLRTYISHTLLVECKMVELLWKIVEQFLKNSNTCLSYNPAITLLGIYSPERKIYVCTKICISMFTAALFVIAKSWKQLSILQWMIKQIAEHLYNRILLSNSKQSLLVHAASWVDIKGIMLNEKSQSQKIIYCMILFI